MIVTFAGKEAKELWMTGKTRRLPLDVARRALVKLQALNAADRVEDMLVPPSNRLKKLAGDLQGFWSLRINDQWRLLFRFEAGQAFDVTIMDYH